MNFTTAEGIRSFWFGHELLENMNNLETIKKRMPIWFNGASVEFDNMQRENAPQVLESSISDTWNGPIGSLAKILLFDQLPRVVFRGTKKAFSFDEQAILEASIIAQDNDLLNVYAPVEQFFIGICLQHSEQLQYQQMGINIAHHIKATAPYILGDFFYSLKGYPNEHHDVILRFGRFPSRNAALGRVSTSEEEEWMASPECPAWAKSQQAVTSTKASMPEVQKEERQKDPEKEATQLFGSVKPYDRHALICTSDPTVSWPSHVENGSEFVELLMQHVPSEVILTLCEKPNSSTEYTDVIVYPDAVVYHVTKENIPAFGKYLSSPVNGSSAECLIPHDRVPFDKLILVCAHESRDKRCGRAGPQIITEMKRRLQEQDVPESQVTVLGSSHFGGHKFAGTLIVYPSSNWYGHVTAKGVSIPSILEAVQNDAVYEKCHRGCANLPTW